jgi:flagellar biosynthesis protein FlhF
MRIKRFSAKNVSQALAEVQVALGPNAVLLETRQITDPGRRRKGELVEVVAAVDPQAIPRPRRPPRDTALPAVDTVTATTVRDGDTAASFAAILDTVASDSASPPGAVAATLTALQEAVGALRMEVGEMREHGQRLRSVPPHNELVVVTAGLVELAQKVDALIAAGTNPPGFPTVWSASPQSEVAPTLLGELERCGLDGLAARHWGERLTGDLAERPLAQGETVAARLAALLGRELRCAPAVNGGIHTILGGSGAGKSTLVVKLALRERLLHGRLPRLITLDYARPEGAALLSRYAEVFGLSLHRVGQPGELAVLIEKLGADRPCFIDAPTTAVDAGGRSRIADLLRAMPEAAMCHLLLPAATSLSEMRRQVAAYTALGVGRLAFSKIDEASHFGQVVAIAAESGMPVSWLSNGRQIPEDLVDASPDLLCALVTRRRSTAPPIAAASSTRARRTMASGDPQAVAQAAGEALRVLLPTIR